MVQLASTKALVRDACDRKLAVGKLVLTFFPLFIPSKLVWTGVRLTSPPARSPPFRQCGICCQFKKPSSVCSDVLLAEAVLGLLDCLGFSAR